MCDSCIEIARGTSLDVHELDAASNNGVDAMRELVSHAALGTPGRWKVYIVDEVHMLSTAASNALLKTLEEPPGHVVFVLATTEPQKVLPTIRSRTQHFEFRLLGPDVLVGLLRQIRDDAGLGLDDDSIDAAVRRGRGSARDALSALDQVAAGGTVDDELVVLAALADALADRDPGRALVCVAQASEAGHDMVSAGRRPGRSSPSGLPGLGGPRSGGGAGGRAGPGGGAGPEDGSGPGGPAHGGSGPGPGRHARRRPIPVSISRWC